MQGLNLRVLSILFIMLVSMLSACGGGGGGGGDEDRSNDINTGSGGETPGGNTGGSGSGETSGDGNTGGQPGGGSSESEPLPTLDRLFELYNQLQAQEYTGLTTQARVTQENALSFARLAVSNQAPVDDSELNQPVEHSGNLNPRLMEDVIVALTLDAPVFSNREVNDERACAGGGTVRYTGKLDSSDAGTIKVIYSQCVVNGVLLNGNGHIYKNAPYMGSILFNDHIDASTKEGRLIITGNNYRQHDGSIINWVVKNDATGFSVRYQNYFVATNNDPDRQGVKVGQISHPSYGYVDVDAKFKVDGAKHLVDGTLTIAGVDSSHVTLYYRAGYIDISLDIDGDYRTDYIAFATFDSLTRYVATSSVNFVLEALANYPAAYMAFEISPSKPTTADVINANVTMYEEREKDEVQFSYDWFINGELLQDQHESSLPPGIAKKGDEVGVIAIFDDGHNLSETFLAEVTVVDAGPAVILEGFSKNIEIDEELRFSSRCIDPDDPTSILAPVELAYGPPGATIDISGNVTWLPGRMIFGNEQTYHFGLRGKGVDMPAQDFEVTVRNPSGLPPITRTGLEYNGNFIPNAIGQFDADSRGEVLMSFSEQAFGTLEKVGDSYVQDWVYPYGLHHFDGPIRVMGRDIDGDKRSEVIVATDNHVFLLKNHIAEREPIYVALEGTNIRYASIGDFRGDGHIELALYIYNVSPGYKGSPQFPNYIEFVNFETRNIVRSFPAPDSYRFFVGNTDGDRAKELVFEKGYVIDSVAGNIEWDYRDAFGIDTRVGDIDGDGTDEIVASRTSPHQISVFSAQTKSLRWTLDTPNQQMVAIENIDTDSRKEVIFIGTDGLVAYDFRTTTPIIDWTKSVNVSDVQGLTVGDVDRDGNKEIIWTSFGCSLHCIYVSEVKGNDPDWMNDTSSRTREFGAAGYAQLAPGVSKALFTARATTNYGTGTSVITLSDNGSVEFFDNSDQSVVGRDGQAMISDYNNDGYAEIFLPSRRDDGQQEVKAIRINDMAEVWSHLSDRMLDLPNILQVGDLNADGFSDLAMATGRSLSIQDLANPKTLFTNYNLANDHHADIAIGNVDSDSANELVEATSSTLSVWKRNATGYAKAASIPQNCRRIAIGDVDDASGNEIVCLSTQASDDYTYDAYTHMVVYAGNLVKKSEVPLNHGITDFSLIDTGNGKQDVIAGFHRGVYGSDFWRRYFIGQVSLRGGGLIWESPPLPGPVTWFNLHSFKDRNGVQRLTYSTQNAMHVTR